MESQEDERKGRRGTYRAGEVEEVSSPLHKRVPEQVLYLLSSFYASNTLGQTVFPLFFFLLHSPTLGDFTGSRHLEVAFMHLRKEH